MQGIRAAIVAHNNATLPDPPPRPRIVAYGDVALTQQGTLLDHINDVFIGKGIYSQVPMPMEDYGEGYAFWLESRNSSPTLSEMLHCLGSIPTLFLFLRRTVGNSFSKVDLAIHYFTAA